MDLLQEGLVRNILLWACLAWFVRQSMDPQQTVVRILVLSYAHFTECDFTCMKPCDTVPTLA